MTESTLAFYAGHSAHSEPLDFARFYAAVPDDLAGLCRWVRNVVFHIHDAAALEPPLPAERHQDRRVRRVAEILDRVSHAGPADLARPRAPQQRFSGTCRDFALLTCSLLRHRAVPARLRVGFAGYFNPPRFEDHWLCEAWDPEQGRWRLLDAQLGPEDLQRFRVDFDPLDVPRDAFLTAGTAWRSLRNGDRAAERFGVSAIGIEGAWFVAGSLFRDLAALNKVELEPWDYWSHTLEISERHAVPEDLEPLLDEIAATLAADPIDLDAVRRLYARPDLGVPGEVVCFPSGEPERARVL